MTASTTAAENLANKGSWRVSAEGNASGNGVINKSVNDVSGLMLVVTRARRVDWGGGITRRPIEEFHPLPEG